MNKFLTFSKEKTNEIMSEFIPYSIGIAFILLVIKPFIS